MDIESSLPPQNHKVCNVALLRRTVEGFVQVDLDPSQDGDARAILNLAGGFHHD